MQVNFLLTSDRDLYVYNKVNWDYIEKNEKDKKKDNPGLSDKIILFKYAVDSSGKEIVLGKKGKIINTLDLIENSSSDLLYLFYTYKSEDSDEIMGYGLFMISKKSGLETGSKSNNFTPEFIDHVNKMDFGKTREKTNSISSNYKLNHCIFISENKINLIFENNGMVLGKSGTWYHSRSIVITQLDKNGNQVWISCLPKAQFDLGYASIFQSHSIFFTKNSFFVFYNDLEENLNYDINSNESPEKFASLKDMNLMKVEIDDQGKMRREKLTSTAESDVPFYVNGCSQLDSKSFFIYCYNISNHHNKFGIATFE